MQKKFTNKQIFFFKVVIKPQNWPPTKAPNIISSFPYCQKFNLYSKIKAHIRKLFVGDSMIKTSPDEQDGLF